MIIYLYPGTSIIIILNSHTHTVIETGTNRTHTGVAQLHTHTHTHRGKYRNTFKVGLNAQRCITFIRCSLTRLDEFVKMMGSVVHQLLSLRNIDLLGGGVYIVRG